MPVSAEFLHATSASRRLTPRLHSWIFDPVVQMRSPAELHFPGTQLFAHNLFAAVFWDRTSCKPLHCCLNCFAAGNPQDGSAVLQQALYACHSNGS